MEEYKGEDQVIKNKVIEFNQLYKMIAAKIDNQDMHVTKKITLLTVTAKHLADFIKDRDTYIDTNWFQNSIPGILKIAKQLNQFAAKLEPGLSKFIAQTPCDCNFHIMRVFPDSFAGYRNSIIFSKHELKYISYDESPVEIKIKDVKKFETDLNALLQKRQVRVAGSTQTISFSKREIDQLLQGKSDYKHPAEKYGMLFQRAKQQLVSDIKMLISLVPVVQPVNPTPVMIPPDPPRDVIADIYETKVEPNVNNKKCCPCCTIF